MKGGGIIKIKLKDVWYIKSDNKQNPAISVMIFLLFNNPSCKTKGKGGGEKKTEHCKLTKRRRSNSIDITVMTLWLCFSSNSNFTHKCKKSKFIRLQITNSKIFVLFNSFLIRGEMINNIWDFNLKRILL